MITCIIQGDVKILGVLEVNGRVSCVKNSMHKKLNNNLEHIYTYTYVMHKVCNNV